MQDDDFFEDEDDIISKTSLKKEALALQELGEALTELKDEHLARIPLDDTLHTAVVEARNIRKHGARKRHMQFIGKLMRNADHEAITSAFQGIEDDQQNNARRLHLVENWRDRLLDSNDKNAMGEFFDACPTADRQQVRQLTKNAQKEKTQNNPPASARKLFKLLRDSLNSED